MKTKLCIIEDCNNKHYGKGWCVKHYMRWRKHSNTKDTVEFHGLTTSPEWRAWSYMKARCNNKNTQSYKNYGGRGIRVCEEWQNNFVNFYRYIGKKPTPQHSLDRINNDGNYEPGNVRWADRTTQSRNSRKYTNTKSGYKGVTWHRSMNKWCVRIYANNKMHNIGVYKNLEEAIISRKNAENEHWKERV